MFIEEKDFTVEVAKNCQNGWFMETGKEKFHLPDSAMRVFVSQNKSHGSGQNLMESKNKDPFR